MFQQVEMPKKRRRLQTERERSDTDLKPIEGVLYRNQTIETLNLAIADIILLPSVLTRIVAEYAFVPDFGLLDCLGKKNKPILEIPVKVSRFLVKKDILQKDILNECMTHSPSCEKRHHIVEKYVCAALEVSFTLNTTLENVFNMIFYGYQCLGISKKLFRYLHALMIKIGENSETFDRPNPRFFVRYIGYWLEFYILPPTII